MYERDPWIRDDAISPKPARIAPLSGHEQVLAEVALLGDIVVVTGRSSCEADA